MPTFYPNPRSSDSLPRGGTFSPNPRGGTFYPSAPRGGSWSSTPRGGAPATGGGTFSSTPRGGSARTPGLTSALGLAPANARDLGAHSHPGALPGPVNAVLRAANISNLAIGDAIQHPSHIIHGGPSFADLYSGRKGESISNAVEQRGLINWIPKKYGVRTGAKLAIDIFGDPTTYVTFGGGAGVKAGARSIGVAASLRIDKIVAEGGLPTMSDVAKAAALSGAERQALPKSLKVFVTLPFTRGKTVLIGESEKASAALDKAARGASRVIPKATRETVSRGVGTGRGLHPVVGEVRQAVHLRAAYETGALEKTAQKLNDAIVAREKSLGLGRNEGSKAISLHLDNPAAYPAPAGMEDLVGEAKSLRDAITTLDEQAGVSFHKVEHYLPHMGAKPADARKIAQVYQRASANKLDEPFFVHPRQTANLDEFIVAGKQHGFTPELNVSKLLLARGRASIQARAKKAIDDAIHGQLGAKPPPAVVPEVGPAAVSAADAQARLEELMQPLPTAGAQADAAATRVAETQARRALAAAHRSGDAGSVRAARQNLSDVQARVAESRVTNLHLAGEPPDAQALAALESSGKVADRRVAAAARRVEKAKASGASQKVISEASANLRRATAARAQARLALERTRAGYVGTPREVAAQTKRVMKANRKLAKAERKAGAVRLANERLALRPERPTTPAEWAALKQEWTSLRTATKYHEGTLLPPDVAESMSRVHKEMTPLFDEGELKRMAGFVHRFTGRWKALALLNPGYALRNLYDDGMRAYMAGARNPASFVQAARMLTEHNPDAIIRIGDKTWTHAQYLRRARAYGVIDTGYIRSDVQSSAEPITSGRFRGPGHGPAARASAAVNNYRENMTRLGTFIELERSGLTPYRAAQKTTDYLFNYSQVGQLVEAARRTFAPFITYPSKAIPFIAKELARRPGRAATLAKVTNALNEAGGNPDLSLLPSYAESSFAVPVPGFLRTAIGAPAGQPLMVNPQNLFAYGSLNMLDPRLSRVRQNYAGGLLGPAFRVPAEILTGKNFFFGSDLPKLTKAPGFVNYLATHGVPVPTYVPAGAEGGKKDFYTGKPIGGYSSYLDEIMRMLPIYGQAGSLIPGGGTNSQLSIGRLGFGVPLTPFDREKALTRIEKFGSP